MFKTFCLIENQTEIKPLRLLPHRKENYKKNGLCSIKKKTEINLSV